MAEIETGKIRIHRDMFSPTPEPQARVMFQALLRKLTGEAGEEIMMGIKDGQFDRFSMPEELAQRANTHFGNAFRDEFGLDPSTNVRRFWRGRQMNGIDVHFLMKDELPNLERRLGIATEVTTPTGDFTDTLGVQATAELPAKFRHEIKRRMLMGIVDTQIEMDERRGDLATELSKIEAVFAQHLFVGPQATIKPYFVYANHDIRTNRVISLDYRNRGSVGNSIRRFHEYDTREIEKIGRVFYDSRVKPRPSAMIKALDRASQNGENNGFIDPAKDVQDRFGVIFVIMNPKIRPSRLSRRIREVLNAHYRPIVNFIIETNRDGYKKTKPSFKMHQAKYTFEDLPTFEAMIFSLPDHINYHCDIGVKNPETGLYSGDARMFYDVARLRAALVMGYPSGEGFYSIDPDRAIADRMEELVGSILQIGHIEEPKPIPIDHLFTWNGSIKDLLAAAR